MDKPKTHDEMARYMSWVGIGEGIDFHQFIIDQGWCKDNDEVEKYLDELEIYPNSYYETSKDNESYWDWKTRMAKCESAYCVDCSHYKNEKCVA